MPLHNLPIRKERILRVVALLLFTIAFGLKGMARGDYALYLKNGTILVCDGWRHVKGGDYHVVIKRDTLVNGKDYSMVIYRDTLLNIAEDKVFTVGVVRHHSLTGYKLDYEYDSLSNTYIKHPDHFVHEHGFFFQWQISVVMIDGMRVMMGYRFNTYVALGLGVGAEYGVTLSEPNFYASPQPNFAPSFVYNSGYSPFFLYLTGDILKTKFTPFYSVDIGYNLPWYAHLQTPTDDGANEGPYSYYTNYGGPTAGLGLGCRINTHGRGNISISVNMNAGYVSIKTDAFVGYANSNYPSNPIYVATTSRYILTQPSLRFSAGF